VAFIDISADILLVINNVSFLGIEGVIISKSIFLLEAFVDFLMIAVVLDFSLGFRFRYIGLKN